jgi:hypothetical protein
VGNERAGCSHNIGQEPHPLGLLSSILTDRHWEDYPGNTTMDPQGQFHIALRYTPRYTELDPYTVHTADASFLVWFREQKPHIEMAEAKRKYVEGINLRRQESYAKQEAEHQTYLKSLTPEHFFFGTSLPQCINSSPNSALPEHPTEHPPAPSKSSLPQQGDRHSHFPEHFFTSEHSFLPHPISFLCPGEHA